MLIYSCLSSHGYGHVARHAAVLTELNRVKPEWKFVVSTSVDPSFLKLVFDGLPVQFRPFQWDVGMVQTDALTVDLESTVKALDILNSSLLNKIISESKWIQSQAKKVIIIADIPPSAAELSSILGVPLIWIGNFGWDDIYKPFGKLFSEYISSATRQYSRGDLLLRLPFSLAMNWGVNEKSVGITYSKPKDLPDSFLRTISRIKVPIITIGFGGIALGFNHKIFKQWPDFHFLLSNYKQKDLENNCKGLTNYTYIPPSFRILDVLPLSKRFICKPGYSSLCEALSQGVGLHVVQRKGFAESEALLKGIRLYGYHRFMDQTQFQVGDWLLDQPLIPPLEGNLTKNGSLTAAMEIVRFSNLLK